MATRIGRGAVSYTHLKRFHAYKRQLLNIMKVMDLYNRRLADPNFKIQPTTCLLYTSRCV